MQSLKLLLCALLTTTLLSACATAPSKKLVICPAITPYDAATQARMSAEIQKLPKDSQLRKELADYMNLRDQVRACRK